MNGSIIGSVITVVVRYACLLAFKFFVCLVECARFWLPIN